MINFSIYIYKLQGTNTVKIMININSSKMEFSTNFIIEPDQVKKLGDFTTSINDVIMSFDGNGDEIIISKFSNLIRIQRIVGNIRATLFLNPICNELFCNIIFFIIKTVRSGRISSEKIFRITSDNDKYERKFYRDNYSNESVFTLRHSVYDLFIAVNTDEDFNDIEEYEDWGYVINKTKDTIKLEGKNMRINA